MSTDPFRDIPKIIAHVDDNPGERTLFREAFKEVDSDCSVQGFQDAGAFLDHLHRLTAEQLPVLAIIDLNLPGSDGLELLSILKKDGLWKNIPVVILSNVLDDATRDRAVALGVGRSERKAGSFDEYLNLAYRLTRQYPQLLRQHSPGDIE